MPHVLFKKHRLGVERYSKNIKVLKNIEMEFNNVYKKLADIYWKNFITFSYKNNKILNSFSQFVKGSEICNFVVVIFLLKTNL